jgi:hypothetical protein
MSRISFSCRCSLRVGLLARARRRAIGEVVRRNRLGCQLEAKVQIVNGMGSNARAVLFQ